jgi:hypothetical protein
MTQQPKQVTVDIDRICEPASKAIARAYVFTGFALNAANEATPGTYRLPGPMQFSFVPDTPNAQMTTEYRQEFRAWSLGNGFREVIEGFAVFLDNLCGTCLQLEALFGTASRADENKNVEFLEKFKRKGVAPKLRDLESRFGFKLDIADNLDSLTAARNCLSHRRGIIEKADCNDDDALLLRYWRPYVHVQEPDGKETALDNAIKDAIRFKDGGTVAMRIEETCKRFPIGSLIKLAPEDVKDIFFTVWNATFNLRAALIRFVSDLNTRRMHRNEN